LELGCFAIKDADGWSWWEVMVHECGASLFNFTADYRSSIFWRWLGDLALLWARFRERWMTGDAFDRGIEVVGGYCGGAGRTRGKLAKTSWILIFEMGFLIVFLFLVVSHAQYWRLRIDGKRL